MANRQVRQQTRFMAQTILYNMFEISIVELLLKTSILQISGKGGAREHS